MQHQCFQNLEGLLAPERTQEDTWCLRKNQDRYLIIILLQTLLNRMEYLKTNLYKDFHGLWYLLEEEELAEEGVLQEVVYLLTNSETLI